jgi:predicted metal-dependent hydrolase
MLQLTLDFLGQQLGHFKSARAPRTRTAQTDRPLAWKHGITVHIVFRPRARRYLLGLRPDGAARLVIPRRGSESEGIRFLERSEAWLLKRVARWHSQSQARQAWLEDARFLFRGEETVMRVDNAEARLCFADQIIPMPRALPDYRDVVLGHLRRLAERELPVRTRELALLHGITVHRVSVRAQKTRWGSCSARGTISLNWRLIQAPPYVVDYLIIHELMHRREMNHSARYWKLVAEAFPDYRSAEQWLKKSGIELRN